MRVGIIQSNYIPWRGYFDFIDDVDLFIIYDDVQFTKNDWRNRNQIKTPNGLKWITVPVKYEKLNKLINETKIDYKQNWQSKHIESLNLNYSNSLNIQSCINEYIDIIEKTYNSISELNIAMIKWINSTLKIDTPLKRSEDFNPIGQKTDRLVDILKKVNASVYLSGPAAKNYLEYDKFKEAGISLEFKSYDYIPYPQLWGEFENYVTVIDLLLNCGPDSRNFLKSKTPNEKFL